MKKPTKKPVSVDKDLSDAHSSEDSAMYSKKGQNKEQKEQKGRKGQKDQSKDKKKATLVPAGTLVEDYSYESDEDATSNKSNDVKIIKEDKAKSTSI